MLEEIIKIWHELIPIHKRVGLKVSGYAKYFEKISPEQLEEALKWLKAFRETEGKAVLKIWSLTSPSQWAWYKQIGLVDTREQGLLKVVDKAYKMKWLKGPIFLKEFKVDSKPVVKKVKNVTGPAY